MSIDPNQACYIYHQGQPKSLVIIFLDVRFSNFGSSFIIFEFKV